MRLLAIETSTTVGGVAIIEDDILIAESRINVKVTHSERIIGAVDYLLKQSGMSIEGIDVFAISIGPGSFTGLRVGLSTIKGFVYATGKRLVSVSTLEAFAWNVPFSSYQVCPLLDARKNEVYAGIFRWDGNGLTRVMDEQTVRIGKLLSGINEPTIFLGEGSIIYKDIIKAWLNDSAIFGNPQDMVPSPANVAYIGMIKAKNGEFEDPIRLVPLYIRRSEAEIKFDR